MINRLLLRSFTFLLIISQSLYSQDLAFEFDGVDDYIEYNTHQKNFLSPDTEWTVEVIFELSSIKENVLLSQINPQNNSEYFVLGVNQNGQIYSLISNYEYIAEELYLEPATCYHLSAVYGVDEILYYLNGSLVFSEHRITSLPDIWKKAHFILVNSPYYHPQIIMVE